MPSITYKVHYRRFILWKSETVIGHQYNSDSDRFDLFYKDGSIKSIANWSKYDLKLGLDWVNATKLHLEEKAGQEIRLAAGIGAK